jgi:hypothetical protein
MSVRNTKYKFVVKFFPVLEVCIKHQAANYDIRGKTCFTKTRVHLRSTVYKQKQ